MSILIGGGVYSYNVIKNRGVGFGPMAGAKDFPMASPGQISLNRLALATGNIFVGDGNSNPSATSTLYISSTGNVGIGTTSPSQKLDVYGNAMFGSTTAGTLFVNSGSQNIGIRTISPTKPLDIRTTSLSAQLRLGDTAGDTYTYDIYRSTAGTLNFYGNQATANGFVFNSIDNHPVAITAVGNLGISTTSPESKLDVWGTSGGKILTLFSNTGTKFLELLNTGVATLLGTWDFNGAIVKINHAVTSLVSADGEIAIRNNNFIYKDNSATSTISANFEKSFYLASTTTDKLMNKFSTATSTFEMYNPSATTTISSLYCKTDVGTLACLVGNGTASSTANCSTAPTAVAISTITLTPRQELVYQCGNSATSPNKVTITTTMNITGY